MECNEDEGYKFEREFNFFEGFTNFYEYGKCVELCSAKYTLKDNECV